ncbi:MAG: hypothetical protein OXF22_10385 [Anaerolineaceae bacterium]|nr:hypothetical protein [Anaerolineaceae bacterium]
MIATKNPPSLRRLRKPTLSTRFHIDYAWWERSAEKLDIYLHHLLPADLRDRLPEDANDSAEEQDWVHPKTGQVSRLNALQRAILTASQRPNFINPQASLVDVVFRILLAHNNAPLTVAELAAQSGRSASDILKLIGSRRVYKGIRPVD